MAPGVGRGHDGASQLVMWVAVVGIVGYTALHRGLAAGYWLSLATGVLFFVSLAVSGSGLLDPAPAGGPTSASSSGRSRRRSTPSF